MKHVRRNNFNADTHPAQTTQTITKSLIQLLLEVNQGQYQDFRAYLLQRQITDLNLIGTALHVDLTHLGCALQNTAVTALGLWNNNIDADGAEKIVKALKGTAVTTLDLGHNNINADGAEIIGIALKGTAIINLYLSNNKIGADGAEKLGKVLKDTAIIALDIDQNDIGPDGAVKLCLSLKDTAVIKLDLSNNKIGADGSEKLGIALKGSALKTLKLTGNNLGDEGAEKLFKTLNDTGVTALDLRVNNISDNGAAVLAGWIPNTSLISVQLKVEHKDLKQALALNQRKLFQTPYAAACLKHLPENEKAKYNNLPILNKPSKEEEIKFAGGILASLGSVQPELQAAVISYLPLMNLKTAQRLQVLAEEHHGHGLQIDESIVKVTNYSASCP